MASEPEEREATSRREISSGRGAKMIVKPFRGFRPRADLSSRIPSYPYDVVDSAEARSLAEGDPHTFLHVVKPEIDLDPAIDPHDERVYAKGAENLDRMIERGWLVRDERPAYYVYRLTMGEHSQTGIVGAAAVADYEAGRIKRHEHTRPAKVEDRVRLNDALSAHPGPVLLTYRGVPELDAAVDALVSRDPDSRFVASDGIEHALWVVSEAAKIESLLELVPASYVADGHHRAAAAAELSARRSRAGGPLRNNAPGRYFLAAHFPAEQLRILDYNRVVTDLNGLEPEGLIVRIEKQAFRVHRDHLAKRPPGPGRFGMYLDGRWFLLIPAAGSVPPDPVSGLDVSVLSDRILHPILGIEDPRTDPRIDFVGGSRGTEELERRVDSGQFAVAFVLFPTDLERVMAVADAGRVMPPKSTWFEPKLRSGMVVQTIRGDRL